MGSGAADFAATARLLAGEARRLGLAVPGFRSPPRSPGLDRALRRRAGGSATVVVRLGRPITDVTADMVEGVVVANGLGGGEADRCRAALWAAVGIEPGRRAA